MNFDVQSRLKLSACIIRCPYRPGSAGYRVSRLDNASGDAESIPTRRDRLDDSYHAFVSWAMNYFPFFFLDLENLQWKNFPCIQGMHMHKDVRVHSTRREILRHRHTYPNHVSGRGMRHLKSQLRNPRPSRVVRSLVPRPDPSLSEPWTGGPRIRCTSHL